MSELRKCYTHVYYYSIEGRDSTNYDKGSVTYNSDNEYIPRFDQLLTILFYLKFLKLPEYRELFDYIFNKELGNSLINDVVEVMNIKDIKNLSDNTSFTIENIKERTISTYTVHFIQLILHHDKSDSISY